MEKNIDFGFVADIYDDYVNVNFDIPFFKSLCKKYSGEILELMCGTGRVSMPLINEGVRLTCVDYSREMLEVFERKLEDRRVPLICQDVCELDIDKKFELIFIPFNSITEITDKEKRRKAITGIYEHLSDDGDFFVTLYNPVYRLKSADGNMKCMGSFDLSMNRTLTITFYNSYDQASNLVYGTQFYEIYDHRNRLVDKRFLNISFTPVTREELVDMCTKAGFKLVEIYGDYEFGAFDENSKFMNFLFTKRRE